MSWELCFAIVPPSALVYFIALVLLLVVMRCRQESGADDQVCRREGDIGEGVQGSSTAPYIGVSRQRSGSNLTPVSRTGVLTSPGPCTRTTESRSPITGKIIELLGSIELVLDRPINKRKQNLVDLLRARNPGWEVHGVLGRRSYARVRVHHRGRRAVIAAIEQIADELGTTFFITNPPMLFFNMTSSSVGFSSPVIISLEKALLAAPRAQGSVELEVDRLINKRKHTLAELLRARNPGLEVHEVSGRHSYARVRVALEDEAAAKATIQSIAEGRGKAVRIKQSYNFDSPRD